MRRVRNSPEAELLRLRSTRKNQTLNQLILTIKHISNQDERGQRLLLVYQLIPPQTAPIVIKANLQGAKAGCPCKENRVEKPLSS